MIFELEVTGGFTGKAGKQLIRIDTDTLGPADAGRLQRDLEQISDDTWGRSFESPHPKPWDFMYELRVEEVGKQKSVRFHLNQGPSDLSKIADQLKKLNSARKCEAGL